MRAFSNANPKNIRDAVSMLSQAHQQGRSASIVGGGSDLLGMVKEHLVAPDVLVNLKATRSAPAVPRPILHSPKTPRATVSPRISLKWRWTPSSGTRAW